MATSARIDELRKKFEENPRRYFAPLANEYRKAGDPERAVAICEEYLPQQPGHMSGHIVYGQALFELGRHDEARQVFETALSLDPENLIALRHLGDIARTAGDAHAARVWYQRVLEADPRNEEIAQLMMSLLSTPVGSEAVDQLPPTPLSTPVVPGRASLPASSPAIQPGPAESQLATTEEVEVPAPVRSAPTPYPPPPVTPQSFVSRHAPKEDELLDLDSFDLGGVPLSSLRAKNAETEAMEAPVPGAVEPEDSGLVPFDEQGVDVGDEPFVETAFAETPFASAPMDVSEPDAPVEVSPIEPEDSGIEKAQEFADVFEADSLAIAAKPLQEGDSGTFEEEPPGTIELAADIDLGLPDDGAASSTFADQDPSIAGLETFEAGTLTGRPSTGAPTVGLETESFFEREDADLGAPSADSLVESFVDDPGVFAGASAFSQVHDDTTDAPASEPDVIESIAFEESPPTEPVDELTAEPSFEAAPFDDIESTPPAALRTPQFGSEAAIDHSTPFPESAPPALTTPQFHEAQPAHIQGDPLMTPAFGHALASIEPAADPDPEPEQIVATPDSAEAEAHVPSGAAPAEEPGAFVTETMATLYLEQGHFDKAIDIYRQLVQQRPDDIALRDRLHAAEERAWGHERELGASIFEEDEVASSFENSESEPTIAPRTYGGPTIREFLTGILYRRSMTAVEEVEPPAADVAEPEATEQVQEDVAATAEVPSVASPPRGTPVSSASDSVSGSLGALFSEADATSEQEDRGSLGGRVATPIGGTPAHRAPTELSLDHVFKSNTPRGPSKDAFSFDQFFSEDAAEESTPSVEPASEAKADTNDDIAQFNAWLNGLKKS